MQSFNNQTTGCNFVFGALEGGKCGQAEIVVRSVLLVIDIGNPSAEILGAGEKYTHI